MRRDAALGTRIARVALAMLRMTTVVVWARVLALTLDPGSPVPTRAAVGRIAVYGRAATRPAGRRCDSLGPPGPVSRVLRPPAGAAATTLPTPDPGRGSSRGTR